MRLLLVELTRLRARRAVLLLLTAAFLVPAVIGVLTWNDTRPPSEADLAEIDRMVAAETEQPFIQRQLRKCLEKPERYGLDQADDVQAACEENVLPQREWFAYYSELDLAQERDRGSALGVVVILGLVGALVGTTFAGHDWSSGSMSNQLLFEPRRGRVWVAKAAAVTGVIGLLATVVLTAYWLGLHAVARARDLTVGDGVLLDCLQMGWRGAAVAAVAAFVSFALTMLFRSTVATLGVMMAVSLAGGLVIGAFGLQNAGRWQPQNNVAAVVLDGYSYYVPVSDECFTGRPPKGVDCRDQRTLTLASGVTYTGGLTGVAALASIVMFRRRDVP